MKSGVQMMSINCSSTPLVSIVEVKLRRLTCQEKLATWIVLHLGMENPTINKTSHGSGRTQSSFQEENILAQIWLPPTSYLNAPLLPPLITVLSSLLKSPESAPVTLALHYYVTLI